MKLGKARFFFIKTVLTFLFMLFITTLTTCYLYSTININKNDYLKLLLEDTYGDNFYVNLVEIINKNFNPLKLIEIKEVKSNNLNVSNSIYITKPAVYIYNSNQNQTYKKEYNIAPTVILSSYFLSNKLNEIGIDSIFEENDITLFSKNNNLNIEDTINLFIDDMQTTYPSLKYIINLAISNERKSVLNIENKKYAQISLYANKDNISLINELNLRLNEKYKGISKVYIDNEYNRFINIEIGSFNNSIKEVINSIEVFSKVFKEVIEWI